MAGEIVGHFDEFLGKFDEDFRSRSQFGRKIDQEVESAPKAYVLREEGNLSNSQAFAL